MGKLMPVQDLFQGALKLNKKTKSGADAYSGNGPSTFMTILKTNYNSSLFTLMG